MNVLFQHLSVMEDMLKDFLLGEHLLLVGNQGVGKNKIVDRFLYLLNRPREYLQLHRLVRSFYANIYIEPHCKPHDEVSLSPTVSHLCSVDIDLFHIRDSP